MAALKRSLWPRFLTEEGGRGAAKGGSFGKQPDVASSGTRGGANGGSSGSNGGSKGQRGFQTVVVCWQHRKFGDQAWDGTDPAACQFTVLGN